MNHLKLFEGFEYGEESQYWKISTKSLDYILLSLKKIGLDSDDFIYLDIYTYFQKEDFNAIYYGYFYIGRGLDTFGVFYWYWSYSISSFKGKRSNELNGDKYKYKGLIKIEDWELAANKYNL
jgi:hypothetical protein